MSEENFIVKFIETIVLYIVRLSTGPGRRKAKPEHLWPDLIGIQMATYSFSHLNSEHVIFFLPAIQSIIRGSRNGYPPVISIISLYLWYQVEFLIIILRFWVVFISVSHFNHIIWGWTVPLTHHVYKPMTFDLINTSFISRSFSSLLFGVVHSAYTKLPCSHEERACETHDARLRVSTTRGSHPGR